MSEIQFVSIIHEGRRGGWQILVIELLFLVCLVSETTSGWEWGRVWKFIETTRCGKNKFRTTRGWEDFF
jgi:hypothetical protein